MVNDRHVRNLVGRQTIYFEEVAEVVHAPLPGSCAGLFTHSLQAALTTATLFSTQIFDIRRCVCVIVLYTVATRSRLRSANHSILDMSATIWNELHVNLHYSGTVRAKS